MYKLELKISILGTDARIYIAVLMFHHFLWNLIGCISYFCGLSVQISVVNYNKCAVDFLSSILV